MRLSNVLESAQEYGEQNYVKRPSAVCSSAISVLSLVFALM
jgi:hypothetical protein